MIFLREWSHSLRAALLIALLAGGILHNASAEDNGLERTPVLGWSSWSFLRQHPTAAQVKAQALALHNSGLQKIGVPIRKPRRLLVSVSGTARSERRPLRPLADRLIEIPGRGRYRWHQGSG